MCGRYYIDDSSEELDPYIEKMLKSSLVDEWHKTSAVKTSGEMRPTDVVPVIASNRLGKQSVFPMRWGFDGKSLLVNARVETAATKPTFQEAWRTRRCIVPASYYFEWEHLVRNDGKSATGAKYAIQPRGYAVTWLCGLYRFEGKLPVFVILTKDAVEPIRFIHERMPLIMPTDLVSKWIDPREDAAALVNAALCDMVAEKEA